MKKDELFEQRCYQLALPYFIRKLEKTRVGICSAFQSVDNYRLCEIGSGSVFKRFSKGDVFYLPNGAFLVLGEVLSLVTDDDEGEVASIIYNSMGFIMGSGDKFSAATKVKMLIFDSPIKELQQEDENKIEDYSKKIEIGIHRQSRKGLLDRIHEDEEVIFRMTFRLIKF